MSITKQLLSNYLVQAVDLLKSTPRYEWGNSGACNCGHLAQAMTGKTRAEIHNASQEKDGDWSEKAKDFCENSGFEIDNMIGVMLSKGLKLDDIAHIEYLSHPQILNKLPKSQGPLSHNKREDVITYFKAWIDLLGEGSGQETSEWNATKSEPTDEVEDYDYVPEYVR